MDKQRIVFWLGCHALRHSDTIRLSIAIMERLGVDVRTVGGARYCCGTSKDVNIKSEDGLGKNTLSRINDLGRDEVVTYCPSCQTHFDNFMSEVNEVDADFGHLIKFLHRHREMLAAQLSTPVERRIALHTHVGFQSRVPINEMARDLLRMIPGIDLVEADNPVPGVQCSAAYVTRPNMKSHLAETLVRTVRVHKLDNIVTIFSACQRQLCDVVLPEGAELVNFVKLLALSMGIGDYQEDVYKAWRTAGDEAAVRNTIGAEAIARVGEKNFAQLVLPELVKAADK
jgi:Fe-S oxidoreductase